MYLRTLGRLELEGTSFQRPKPLLLLAYLAIEGPKPRRVLADLFFMDTADAFNSLSRAVSYLRRDAPGSIESDEKRVWTTLECDVKHFLALLDAKDLDRAITLYKGMFLEGFDLPLGEELEEWLYAKREHLAGRVQSALLTLAEQSATRGDFASASKRAEQAYLLESAPEPEPEALSRFYALFVAGNSSYVAQVRATAKEFDIDLSQTTLQSQQRLHKPFLGRKRELERLTHLEAGQWAWVKGGAGIGKTSLLQQLQGQYVPGRMGLPYATLEPLVSDLLNDGAEAILRRLSKQEKTLCIDDWDNIDLESQEILKRLRTLKPNLKVIISATSAPPFAVDVLLELSPLPREALEATSELWEKTGGVPKLVGAHLRGESLGEALELTLTSLAPTSQQVYLALALLGEANPSLVRQALGLTPEAMFTALEELSSTGLVSAVGRSQLDQLAKDYLSTKPHLLALLALELARQLEATRAFPLFQLAKTLWSKYDMPKVQQAYLCWAKEILERGFPQRAADVLAEIEGNDEIRLLRAQALEECGRYTEAIELINTVSDTPQVSSLKAQLLWRIGQGAKADEYAKRALEGDLQTQARAYNVLGNVSQTNGDLEMAETYYRKVATLWTATGNRGGLARVLSNIAMVMAAKNLPVHQIDEILKEALKIGQDYPQVLAWILLNIGSLVYERQKDYKNAELAYKECLSLQEQYGFIGVAIHAWNNLGVIYYTQGRKEDAAEAYSAAINLLKDSGDILMLGISLANLAEIKEDRDMWQHAHGLLNRAGLAYISSDLWKALTPSHPFQVLAPHPIQNQVELQKTGKERV
jgi:tetratricopeptide (TPR) repeat protein/DNA-binding SARP family transcriptional activator